jgi:hypothetical protein
MPAVPCFSAFCCTWIRISPISHPNIQSRPDHGTMSRKMSRWGLGTRPMESVQFAAGRRRTRSRPSCRGMRTSQDRRCTTETPVRSDQLSSARSTGTSATDASRRAIRSVPSPIWSWSLPPVFWNGCRFADTPQQNEMENAAGPRMRRVERRRMEQLQARHVMTEPAQEPSPILIFAIM